MGKPETQILIVEDEPLIAKDIALNLERSGYSICGVAHNANDAVKCLRKNPPALALLDIKINGEVDGLMLARIIKDEFRIPFIFLTSYTDDATLNKVKELKPYGFIVKPFDSKELVSNIEIALHRFKTEQLENTQWDDGASSFFYVKRGGDLIKINADDITFSQAFDNYCYVNTTDSKYLIPHTLKSVEQKLGPQRFFRIHRSFLVNIAHIDVIGEDTVTVEGNCLPLSRTSRTELMQRISLL